MSQRIISSVDIFSKLVRIIFAVLFIFIFSVSFGAAQLLPDRNELEKWTFPPIDYQNIREGCRIDPQLKIALEEMRKVLDKAKNTLLEQPSDDPSSSMNTPFFRNWSSCVVQYIVLLREAGLDVTAEKTLDTFPKYPRNELRYRLLYSDSIQIKRKKTDDDDLKKNRTITEEEMSQLAKQLWTQTSGMFSFGISTESSFREFFGLNHSFRVPIFFGEEKLKKPIRLFHSYKEWATDFITKYTIEKQNILNKLKTLSAQKVHYASCDEVLSYAILLSVMGFQEEARQTVQKAKELAQKYVEQNYEQNSSRYKLREPIIRDEQVWRNIITAYIVIGEYQSVMETLNEVKEDFTKLYVAGETHSWRDIWQQLITKLIQWIAVENSVEQAVEFLKLYSDFMARDDVISNVAQSLALRAAKEGRTTDVEKYLQFMQKENSSKQEIYFECCRYAFQQTSLEQTSVLLKKYFPQIASTGLQNTKLNKLGILFLKTGNEESARKIFDKINDSLKFSEVQAINNYSVNVFSNQNEDESGKLLAERYNAGWTEPTLQFLETFTDPIFRCRIFCSFVTAVADGKGAKHAEVTKKFLRLAYESAIKTNASPFSTLTSSYSYQNSSYIENSRSIRIRLLWLITRTALMTDHLTLARQTIRQERTDSKNATVIGDQEIFFPDHHNFVSHLIAKEDLSTAIFVLKEIDSADLKYQIALQLAVKLIESPPHNNEIVGKEQSQQQKQTSLFRTRKPLRERK
jgi:tetratricopeptide (TPR) repeat protein